MGPAVVVTPQLEVVLATCNGERFLELQLQSLRDQQRRPERLLVLDDGSSDGTLSILERWQRLHPGWVQRLPAAPHRLGPTATFNRLLQASSAPYVALCDQDDIWHPNRLATGLSQLQAAEASSPQGTGQPLLLHSDAELINAQGDPQGTTLWQRHRVRGQQPPLWRLALRNQITGCTMLCNRSLLLQALPIPADAVLHDWWLALVACRCGGLIACPEPLLLHRRHGRNASGPCQHLPLHQRLRQRLRQWRALHRISGCSSEG